MNVDIMLWGMLSDIAYCLSFPFCIVQMTSLVCILHLMYFLITALICFSQGLIGYLMLDNTLFLVVFTENV